MAAIARRAGVGVATLYRRFPTRESLITEVFAEQLASCVSVVDDALVDPEPWRGFRTVVEKVCAMQVTDRGFTVAFLAEIVRRAQAAGQLRADFAPAISRCC